MDNFNKSGESSSSSVQGPGSRVSVSPQAPTMYSEKLIQTSLDVASGWLELYQTSSSARLLESIQTQIRLFVPLIFSPKENCDCLHLSYDTDLETEKLTEPMELFLSGLQSPDKFYQKLSAMEPPSTLCGRVFKWGEPTYSCRDCGMDPTCVLCVDCFRKSAHRHHKYKISTSQGGGCCDCGDPEAWKVNYFCTDHSPLTPDRTEQQDTELEDIQNRARVLFLFLLEFCHEILTAELTSPMLGRNLVLEDMEIEAMRISCSSDMYGTVLYNDEVHTFELVIQTLARAVECSKDVAKEYATVIDREGRSLVKCSDFQTCSKVKQMIEKQTKPNSTKPLKVAVIQAHLFAHQTFAIQVLKWINKLISISSHYRTVFANLMSVQKTASCRPGHSLLEAVLYNDSKLWITVRSLWHHLCIAGLLKEYDNKKYFSQIFSKLYPELMRDFFEDDHDHSVSITSLSVQIFTVPSIAHCLLEQEDIFYKIIHTFMAVYEPKLNGDETLEFDRHGNSNSVKRAFYCTVDLQYVLSLTPIAWTEGLRKGFLHGFGKFLTLLRWMENMDAVVRQTLQHMEYEPDWESGFNLHIKLSSVISLVQEWCGTDRTVLIVAYRKTLSELNKIYNSDDSVTLMKREFASHFAFCTEYDVSRQPVSVHKPLSRLFAGLYLRLGSFNLDFTSSTLQCVGEVHDRSSKPRLAPPALVEPAVRTQVLVGQVHANMWRRNGFSLLNQIYFYTNVKCRSEMLDKDIVSLQFGASTIESNKFLIQTLDRYGLFPLLSKSFPVVDISVDDDSVKNLRQLLDEFLYLIIVVVSARYTVGVGQVTPEDCIRKEVIQQLCIEPMTHSALNKSLVETASMETGLDSVVNQVALTKKHTVQNGIMKYELKPEFYAEYDCFHYHYTREEQSKAEQAQICRKKSKKESCCFPPPVLPRFVKNFEAVVGLLNSDVLLVILSSIIRRECVVTQHRRCGSERDKAGEKMKDSDLSQSTSDPLMQKTLHLICLGLNEERIQKELSCSGFAFYTSAQKHDIFQLLEEYSTHSLSYPHVEMIRQVFLLCETLSPPLKNENMEDSNFRAAIPMDVELSGNVLEQEERKKKSKLAEEARAKMLAQISAAQKSFMAVNADLFAEDEVRADPSPNTGVFDTDDSLQRQALGHTRTYASTSIDEVHICILCQEEQNLSDLSRPFVMAAYVQRSSVYCQARAKLTSEDTLRKGSFAWQERDPSYLGPDLISVPYVSCCGHMMHVSCWNKHYENVQAKERRRPYRHPVSFDVDKREYLCPMCDCISNLTLPMTNPLFKLFPGMENCNQQIPGPFDVWVEAMQVIAKERITQGDLPCCQQDVSFSQLCDEQRSLNCKYDTCSITTVLERLQHRQDEFEVFLARNDSPVVVPCFSDNFKELITNFSQMVYSVGLDVRVDSQDFRLPLLLWQGLAFTIIAQEDFSRDQRIPFFGSDVPARKELGVDYFIRSVALATQQYFTSHPEVIKSHAIKLLTTVVTSPADLPCVLECDAFSLLVGLTEACPALLGNIPDQYHPFTGTNSDFNICRLLLLFHVTQVFITKDFSSAFSSGTENRTGIVAVENNQAAKENTLKNTSALSRLEHLVSEVWRISGIPAQADDVIIDYNQVWDSVRLAVIPYLRCCCKLYEKLTCVSTPASLNAVDTAYEDLVRFLGLPVTFEGLFDSRVCWQLPYRWASHPRVKKILSSSYTAENSLNSKTVALVTYPRKPVELALLPTDYTELINSVSSFTCKSNVRDSRAPTTCLVCGITLCSQSYCCQFSLGNDVVGACTFHSYFCGGGKGIFLRNRDCKMFFIGGKGKGCNSLPPYVDQYGETDQGLKRGNPLYLDCERYSHLRKSWMLHSLPEEIARFVENSTIFSAMEWQLV